MAFGAAPEVRYALRQRSSLRASVIAQSTVNWLSAEREGNNLSVNISGRRLINQGSFVDVGFRHTRENTRVSFLDNNYDSIYLGFYRDNFWGLSCYVRPTVGWNEYDEKEAAFSDARDDFRLSCDVNLSKEIGDSGLFAGLGYTYTNNDSNLSLYQFERHQVTFQVWKDC